MQSQDRSTSSVSMPHILDVAFALVAMCRILRMAESKAVVSNIPTDLSRLRWNSTEFNL